MFNVVRSLHQGVELLVTFSIGGTKTSSRHVGPRRTSL